MILDNWQQKILEHKGNLLLCTGRQVGKTTIFAHKAAEYMMEHPAARILIVSLTEDQAKLIIVMILSYLEQNYKKEIAKGKDKPTLNRITLKNKAQALARPVGTTGSAMRGFTGDVLIIDEGSRMPEMAFQSSRPTLLTTGGEIWMASTPFGKEGYFYECFQNKDERWMVFHKSSEDVIKNRKISEDWTEEQREKAIKFLESEKKSMSKIAYSQEYLGLFMEDLNQLFSDELIRSCMFPKPEKKIIGKNFLGVDLASGKGGDQTVLVSLVKTEKKLRMFDLDISTKTELTGTVRLILWKDLHYNYRKIYVDSGGLGVAVSQTLLETLQTRRKIVEINNAARSIEAEKGDKDGRKKRILKEDLYANLLWLMENSKISFFDDPEVFQSLKSVQIERTEGKTKIFGNYTHIAEAIIRGAWCIKDKSLSLWAR